LNAVHEFVAYVPPDDDHTGHITGPLSLITVQFLLLALYNTHDHYVCTLSNASAEIYSYSENVDVHWGSQLYHCHQSVRNAAHVCFINSFPLEVIRAYVRC